MNVYEYYSRETDFNSNQLTTEEVNKLINNQTKFCVKLSKPIQTILNYDNQIKLFNRVIFPLNVQTISRVNIDLFKDRLNSIPDIENFKIECSIVGYLDYLNIDIEKKIIELSNVPFFTNRIEYSCGQYGDNNCIVCFDEIESEELSFRFVCCNRHIHRGCCPINQRQEITRCYHCRSIIRF